MGHHQSRTLPGLVTVPKPTKATRVFIVVEVPQDCKLTFDGIAPYFLPESATLSVFRAYHSLLIDMLQLQLGPCILYNLLLAVYMIPVSLQLSVA